MATNVTLPGAGRTTVTIPYTTAQIGNLAQTASKGVLSYMAQLGQFFTVESYNGTGAVPPPASPAIAGLLDISGSGTAGLGLLPTGYLGIANTATTEQVMLNASSQATTVWSGTGGIVYGNLASSNQDFVAGGVNLFAEETGNATSLVYSDAATTNYITNNNGQTALTAVEALSGSSTVIGAGGSAILVWSGTGSNSVSVGAGTNFVEVSNANTVAGTTTAVTVTATSGELDYKAAGAPGVIDPNASNVIILPGSTGTVTLNAGTGSDTVFAGPSGVIHAGSGGGSILNTSATASIAAATTLFGGGSGDQLIANTGGAVLVAGAGNEQLFATGTNTTGVTFDTGSGADTITGSALGGDTVNLGSGTVSLAFQFHNTNTVSLTGAGGQDTVNFFRPGTDVFHIGTRTVSSNTYAGGNTSVVLSDGTNLTFVSAHMLNTNFTA